MTALLGGGQSSRRACFALPNLPRLGGLPKISSNGISGESWRKNPP